MKKEIIKNQEGKQMMLLTEHVYYVKYLYALLTILQRNELKKGIVSG